MKNFLRSCLMIFAFTALTNAFAATENQLLSEFKDNYGRMYYYIMEITNYLDTEEPKSYDYVNPHATFGYNNFTESIIKNIPQLIDVEKSNKERRSRNDIDEFLKINYKTGYVPARVYNENPHLEKPYYISDLRKWVFEAIAKGDLYAVRAMLENYNIADIKNNDGYGILSYSILHGQSEVAELLIKKGLNINEKNRFGATPINLAARTNNIKIVKLLSERKDCIVFHKDKFGNTALDYAYITNNKQMHDYLVSIQKTSKSK